MKKEILGWFVFTIFLFFFGVIVSFRAGELSMEEKYMKEAIKDGKASYVLKDGGPGTEFRWK